MSGRLAGKRAVVTAAAAGIGRAIALAFAAEGADVLATDIDDEGLATLGGGGVLRVHALNVTDPDAVRALFAAEPAFDILVNAAGRVDGGTILECSDTVWEAAFDLNVRSMHRMIAAALPGMLAAGRGSIINIGSVASSLKGVTNRYVYSTTKAAVIGLTKAVAVDFVAQESAATSSAPEPSTRPRWAGVSLRQQTPRRRAATSSPASPWAVSVPRRRSHTWRSTWPATKPHSPAEPST